MEPHLHCINALINCLILTPNMQWPDINFDGSTFSDFVVFSLIVYITAGLIRVRLISAFYNQRSILKRQKDTTFTMTYLVLVFAMYSSTGIYCIFRLISIWSLFDFISSPSLWNGSVIKSKTLQSTAKIDIEKYNKQKTKLKWVLKFCTP